jgi:hypothetical protein
VAVGHCPPGEWCKAVALADGLTHTGAPNIVVADGDMFTAGLTAAVDAVDRGWHWAVPHTKLHRLTLDATQQVLASDPADRIRWQHLPVIERPYTGVAGGSMTVVTRQVLDQVPMPPIPRWGQQDQAWAEALGTLVGPCWRGSASICHLWHDPPQRISRRWGSQESRAWYGRYVAARGKPGQMRQVIDEDRAVLAQRTEATACP